MSAPPRWLVARVGTDRADLLPLAAEVLVELGSAGVQEDGGTVVAYLPEPSNAARFTAAAAERLTAALAPAAASVMWEWRNDEDWARTWRAGLAPREVTPRLVVKPSWTAWEARAGQVVIDIDPQMAFGTGEHATTRGCLRLLDTALRPGDRVLDVGSGSAILAIAAARLGAASVVAVEYDADANLNARENLARNGVAEQVWLVEALADKALLGELGRFDLVLANILSGVIRPLLPALHDALAPDGRLIVSGILRAESADVAHAAEAAGFRVARVDEEEEWWSALLVVPTATAHP